MKPIEVSCTHTFKDRTNCAAQSGEPCRDNYMGCYCNLSTDPPFHAERIIAAAAFATGPGETPTVEEFDKAVEDLDI
jgi:hypothetical protein